MLSAQEIDEYRERGYLRLPKTFPDDQVSAIRDRVWSFLERERGVQREDPSTWRLSGAWLGLKQLKEEALFQSLHSEELTTAINQILGEGLWRRPRHWGGFLVNFLECEPEEFQVPARGWHVDFHFTHEPGSDFGIRVFTVLARLPARSGGTLHLTGSHRLVERFVANMTPAQREKSYTNLVAEFNRSHPWINELCNGSTADPERIQRFMGEGIDIDDIHLRVEQITGEAGDVVLAHPWLLHTGVPNAGPVPRMMIAKLIYAEAAQLEPS
ncbi:MAG: phytanoyl-CoA dioxygenase family protein [Planctomycetota bacterium]|jgi:hypothetical protein